jgi:IgGFc binding protein/Ca-dependent carbohydrate-binding module xylan-binding/Bacterial Ig-like domain (group 1)/Putative Ig domain/PKD domain
MMSANSIRLLKRRNLITTAVRNLIRRKSRRKRVTTRTQRIEQLELRQLLAVASPPDQLLLLSEPTIYLAAGHFDSGGPTDILNATRSGRIDVVRNGNQNSWSVRSSFTVPEVTLSNPVLGATTAILNNDAFDDLILQTASSVIMLTSDGNAGWQPFANINYPGVLDPATHPTVKPITAILGNDTRPDLFLLLPQTSQFAVLKGNPSGGFESPLYFSTHGSRPTAIAIANLLGSPSNDLVVGMADGSLRFFEGSSNGVITPRNDLTLDDVVGVVTAIETADFDGDGLNEMVVAGVNGTALLKSQPDPLAASPIINGDFSLGLAGWRTQIIGHPDNQIAGFINAKSTVAQFHENNSFLTSLSQSFTIPPNPQRIEFDVLALGLETESFGQLPDAFEVSLLDDSSQSLVPTHQPTSTAFVNFGVDASRSAATGVTLQGTKVILDISRLTPGMQANLIFDLVGNPNPIASTATIDNVRIIPEVLRDDAFSVTKLIGGFGLPSDLAIGDIDGDQLPDIVVADAGLSALIIYNGTGGGAFMRSRINTSLTGNPSEIALGSYTAPDPILDIAVGFTDKSLALTPLVADTTLPTAMLVAPSPTLQLATTQDASSLLGSIVLQFSEPMQATNPNVAGSANNPKSYKFYNYGPDGVDNRGTGDDISFSVNLANYNTATNQVTLTIDPTSLADPMQAAAGIYKVIARGAGVNSGLRDLAGNPLDGGQDFSAQILIDRALKLELPSNLLTQEGASIDFSANLTHYAFDPQFTATIQWGDGSSSSIVGNNLFPSESFTSTHVYSADGNYQISVSILDRNNTSVTAASTNLQVENVAPNVADLPLITSNEGTGVAVRFTATDRSSEDTLAATIDWGDGTTTTLLPTLVAGEFEFKTHHTFPDNGIYKVRVSVSDGVDLTVRTATAAIANVAPTFVVPNATATVGQPLVISKIQLSDPGFNSQINTTESFTATIDWGDETGTQAVTIADYVAGQAGTPTTAAVQLAHTYTTVGQYIAQLIVRDDDGGTTVQSFEIHVQPSFIGNACLPVIDFDTDALGNGIGSKTNSITELWSSWGVHLGTSNPSMHPLRIATLVADSVSDNVLVMAENPTATTPTSYPGGGTISFTFDAPVRLDQLRLFKIPRAHSATLRWYDPSSNQIGELQIVGDDTKNHQTALLNAIGVRKLDVQFTGGGAISDLAFCNDQVPGGTVQATGPSQSREGQEVVLGLTSLGSTDGWTINWGDGHVSTLPAGSLQAKHVFADGPSTAIIRTFARQGISVFAGKPLNIAMDNVIPQLTIAGNASVNAGEAYVLSLATVDPGRDTIQGWLIDWGDGTKPQLVAGSPSSITHIYIRHGNYSVRAHAFDEDYDGPRHPAFSGSLIQIQARGDEGGEQFELLVDDQVVESYTTSTEFQLFSFATTKAVAPNQIKVRFTNDRYDPIKGIDYNLLVDCIVIDGKPYQSEAPDVYSTGTWLTSEGLRPGFRNSEWLHSNGYFHYDYDANDGTRLIIRARGDQGDEKFNLLINERIVKTFTVTKSFADYEYRSSRALSPEQIRIAFTNDLYDRVRKIDRNLTVDYLKFNDRIYQTEDKSVYSTASWLPADGLQSGYGRSQTLHTNGYFQFAEIVGPSPFDTAWVSNTISLNVLPEKSIALPTIDFERAADGSKLRVGDQITAQFSSLGITVSTESRKTPATIIDSRSSHKNVLAIARNDHDDDHDDDNQHRHDDHGHDDEDDDEDDRNLTSGKLVFQFRQSIQLDEVHLLNVTSNGSRVVLFAADGSLITDIPALRLSPNSFQKVILNATGVRRMEIVLANAASVAAIVSSRQSSPIPPPPTKFYVVDSDDWTYRYSSAGSAVGKFTISSAMNARDIATTGKGNPLWVLSDEGSSKRIYVTDSEQEKLIGSWIATGLTTPEGIATDGKSIWIVDDGTNRVLYFEDAAARRSGTSARTNQFGLDSANQSPKGLTTDGEFIWVVDSSSDKIFVYDTDGKILNSWRLASENTDPTGLTINADGDKLWVVDGKDDRVYIYSLSSLGPNHAARAMGSFALASGNTNPQGIADPGGAYTIGDIRASNIAAPNATDDWVFDAVAGQKVYVNFQSLSSGGLQSSLFTPDGTLVYSRDHSQAFGHNSGVISLPHAGLYTLRLTSTETPSYQFQIFNVSEPDVNPIVFGQLSSGAVETPGVEDQWTFTGRGRTDVYLDVITLNTVIGGDVIFAIVAPDGTTISSRSFTREFGVDQRVTLPIDGLYKIVVKADYDGAQLPTYSFQLWEVPPDDVQSIDYRLPVSGAIEVPGAKDRWTFTATAGQNVFIDFLEVTGGDLNVTLAAPDGTLLYNNFFSLESGLDQEITLPQSGTYTLSAFAARGTAALNTYRFQLWDIPNEEPQQAVLNERLFGSTVPGESKIYFIDAQANTPILLDIFDSSSKALGVTLLAPDGSTLVSRATQDQLLTLTLSGQYRAIVQPSSTDPTALDAFGTFAFRLQDASSPTVGGLDSLGTRFYIGFPRNLRELLGQNVPAFSISVTSTINTSGTVQIPGLSSYFSFDVVAGQTTTIPLPPEVEIFASDAVGNQGIIVTAVDEIAVFGLNQMPLSTDGYTALPADAVGRSYVVMAYGNTSNLAAGGGTSLTIVGTADNTLVTIHPTIAVGARAAAVPFTISINAGQSYTLHAETQFNNLTGAVDLTGTKVTADKPISVFGGNTAAVIPAGFSFADHLIEQLPPIETFGKQFLTVPLATRTRGDTFRILAQADNTEVRINGALVATLAAGRFFETILTSASTVDASQPVLVSQYSNSTTFDSVPSDPFMMLVPPIEQFQSDYTLSTPAVAIDVNYANLLVPNAAISDFRRNGQLIPSNAFTAIGSSGFSVVQIPIGIGSHRFVADAPFGISIYGFNNFDSYGYFGGQSLAPLSRIASLSLAPTTSIVPLNTQQTMTATLADAQGNPIRGVRVEFLVTGSNPTQGYSFSDSTGRAVFQLTGTRIGSDTVTATAAGRTQSASLFWSTALPEIEIQSPTANESVSVGQRVLVGRALPAIPGTTIVEVLVNGKRIEAIDASGRFIAPIEIAQGDQTIVVSAIDSLGQQSTTSLDVTGVVGNTANFSNAPSDITATTQVRFSGTTFHRTTQQLSVDMRIRNLEFDGLDQNTAVRFDAIDPIRVELLNPDQLNDDGLPLVLFNSQIPSSGLGKDQTSQAAAVVLHNPQHDRFAPSLTVLTQANRPPQFATAPPVTAVVDRTYRYAVTAVDPDGSTGLAFELTSGPPGMTIDSKTGLIAWNPTATDVGTADIVIRVQDARGGQATQSYSLTVLLNPTNRPPVFITEPIVSLAPLGTYHYAAAARDVDGDTIVFSLAQFPSGMTIDSATGLVQYPSPVAGIYPVTILANDGRSGVATQEFTLFVGTAANRTAPLITSVPPVVAVVNMTYIYTISATDTSSQSLQFQLLQAPTGMTISPSGRITWQPQAAQVGLQNVQLQVTNASGGSAAQSFTVEAITARPNQGPWFTSTPLPIATVDQEYLYTAVAEDPEQSALTYRCLS